MAMTRAQIIERVAATVAGELGLAPEAVIPEAHIEKDLHADSLDRVHLTMALEDEFGLTIADADAQRLTTVGAVHAYLYQRFGVADTEGAAL